MSTGTISEPMASTEMLEEEYFRMANVEARMWWYTTLHANLLDRIQRVFGEDKQIRILDAGCGTGGFLRYLQQQGYHNSIGVDISSIAVDLSRKQGFTVSQGSIADPVVLRQLGKVDVIVSMDVLCSLPDETQRVTFLREAVCLLTDKALMVVQTPAFACLGGIHDRAVGVNKRYNKAELRELLRRAGISDFSLQYRLVLLTPVIWLVRLLQRFRLKFAREVAIESDVKMPPRLVNRVLSWAQGIEDRWLPFRPFGTSLQIVISKECVKDEVRT